MRQARIGTAILPQGIFDHWLIGYENGSILCSAPAASEEAINFINRCDCSAIERLTEDFLMAPAFVDIHCHAGKGIFTHEDPMAVMQFHRSFGTGFMLHTLYRNLGVHGIENGILLIKEAMKQDSGILGVHLEGPYLNPAYGCKSNGEGDLPNPEDYRRFLDTGIIRMWTFAPEVAGTQAFCREIVSKGVVAAIGHSAAPYADVHRAVEDGATVVTHIFDASGLTDGPICYAGTKNLSFDEACMLENGMWYEVINDRYGYHVRHEMIRLLEKTVGKSRIVAITDCFGGVQEGTGDVNFQNGEIAGSRMTMLDAARNFLAMGYSLTDVFSFVSLHPAQAIGMGEKIGSLEVGKSSEILLVKKDLSEIRWLSKKESKG